MSEREAFGPSLRRHRVQRGVSLERIATATKVSADIWAALERNDLSRWPSGIYARAYIRAYALEVGLQPDATVDEFCRCFANGDRRVDRIVREQAAILGHDLHWKDDLIGSVTDEKRSTPLILDTTPLPSLASTRTGRIVAAAADVSAVAALAGVATLLPVHWSVVLAVVGVAYHATSMVALGCTPAAWVIDTYLTNRHPGTGRSVSPRFLRLLRSSHRAKA